MAKPDITLIPILSDNYCVLLCHGDAVIVIDPGEATPVINALSDRALTPTHILNTHHHPDHTKGNAALKKKYTIPVYAPLKEKNKIPTLDYGVQDQDILSFGSDATPLDIHVLETAGHTKGHVCFWIPRYHLFFSGDLLFAMGCGRLLEGTMQELYASVTKIKTLPPETLIYCGHEYTLANAEFCLSQDPDNQDLKDCYEIVKQLRQKNQATLPTTLGRELKTNCFLRASSYEDFHRLRTLRDSF